MLAGQLVDSINGQRRARGLGPVAVNQALTSSAQKYSYYAFTHSDPYQLDHNLDGTPTDRAEREGYTGLVGEVLATSAPSPDQIINLWLSSPPHYSILMGAQYVEIGMGCEEGPYQTSTGGVFDIALCVGDLGYH